MNSFKKYNNTEIGTICNSLFKSAETIYTELKSGSGLEFANTTNASSDEQIQLDVFADQCFQKNIAHDTNVKYILSEERPNLIQYGDGQYSLALDPLDGSKSAIVGIPSGAIFGIFEQANSISDFNGSKIVCGGFFVFGINLEVYFAIQNEAIKGVWNSQQSCWQMTTIDQLPSAKMFSINASNKAKWENWLQEFYHQLMHEEDEHGKSYNLRWYASMVSEIKRLVIQGGLFAYPSDKRKGYANGHLRLVYEAIPMSYLIQSIGGNSTDGFQSILEKEVTELHQKTPVFIGDKTLIQEIENIKK